MVEKKAAANWNHWSEARKGRGRGWIGVGSASKTEPQQEADSLSHMAVWISPVNFTSQFYILSLHITRKGHSVLKVGRSDLVIQSTNIYWYHVPGIFWKDKQSLIRELKVAGKGSLDRETNMSNFWSWPTGEKEIWRLPPLPISCSAHSPFLDRKEDWILGFLKMDLRKLEISHHLIVVPFQ